MSFSPLCQKILKRNAFQEAVTSESRAKRPKVDTTPLVSSSLKDHFVLLQSMASSERPQDIYRIVKEVEHLRTSNTEELSVITKVQALYKTHFSPKKLSSHDAIATGLEALVAAGVVPKDLQNSFQKTSSSLKAFPFAYQLRDRLILSRLANEKERKAWIGALSQEIHSPRLWEERMGLFFQVLDKAPLTEEEFEENGAALCVFCQQTCISSDDIWSVYLNVFNTFSEGEDGVALKASEWFLDLFAIFVKRGEHKEIFKPLSFLADFEVDLFLEVVQDWRGMQQEWKDEKFIEFLSLWMQEEKKKDFFLLGHLALMDKESLEKEKETWFSTFLSLIGRKIEDGMVYRLFALLEAYLRRLPKGKKQLLEGPFVQKFSQVKEVNLRDLQQTYELFLEMQNDFSLEGRRLIFVHMTELFFFHHDVPHAEKALQEGFQGLYEEGGGEEKHSYITTTLFFYKAVALFLQKKKTKALSFLESIAEDVAGFPQLSFLAGLLRQKCESSLIENTSALSPQDKEGLTKYFERLTSSIKISVPS